MRTFLTALAISIIVPGCSPMAPTPVPIQAPPPAAQLEDPACSYVFSEDDTKAFAGVLKQASAGQQCSLDGVRVEFSRVVTTWTVGGQKETLTFLPGQCGAQASGTPLVVVEGDKVRADCPAVYDAAMQAIAGGRLPTPKRRSDTLGASR